MLDDFCRENLYTWQLTGLASWYVFFRESDPDFKQSYVTLSEPDAGKQTEGELALVDKLKVIHH